MARKKTSNPYQWITNSEVQRTWGLTYLTRNWKNIDWIFKKASPVECWNLIQEMKQPNSPTRLYKSPIEIMAIDSVLAKMKAAWTQINRRSKRKNHYITINVEISHQAKQELDRLKSEQTLGQTIEDLISADLRQIKDLNAALARERQNYRDLKAISTKTVVTLYQAAKYFITLYAEHYDYSVNRELCGAPRKNRIYKQELENLHGYLQDASLAGLIELDNPESEPDTSLYYRLL